MHVCMYVLACIYPCMHPCVCMYVIMYVCMHACMYVGVCVCVYVCLCMCAYAFLCMCAYVCMLYMYVSAHTGGQPVSAGNRWARGSAAAARAVAALAAAPGGVPAATARAISATAESLATQTHCCLFKGCFMQIMIFYFSQTSLFAKNYPSFSSNNTFETRNEQIWAIRILFAIHMLY